MRWFPGWGSVLLRMLVVRQAVRYARLQDQSVETAFRLAYLGGKSYDASGIVPRRHNVPCAGGLCVS